MCAAVCGRVVQAGATLMFAVGTMTTPVTNIAFSIPLIMGSNTEAFSQVRTNQHPLPPYHQTVTKGTHVNVREQPGCFRVQHGHRTARENDLAAAATNALTALLFVVRYRLTVNDC